MSMLFARVLLLEGGLTDEYLKWMVDHVVLPLPKGSPIGVARS